MSLFINNNFFYYVPKGIAKFILLVICRIKALMPLNLKKNMFLNFCITNSIRYAC